MFPLLQFRTDARRLDLDAFAGLYAEAFFVYWAHGDAAWEHPMQGAATDPSERGSDVAYSWAIPLRKRPGPPERDYLVVGRLRLSDVVISHSTVSKTHAYVFSNGPVYALRDLGSSNGTRVNGVPLGGERTPIAFGDRIVFGGVEVSLVGAADFWEHLRRTPQAKSATPRPIPSEESSWTPTRIT
jgi:hypothetical protein